MRKLSLVLMIAAVAVSHAFTGNSQTKASQSKVSHTKVSQGNVSQTKLSSSLDSVSYAIGVYEGGALATKLKGAELTVNKAAFLEALGLSMDEGAKEAGQARMSSEQAMSIIQAFFTERSEKQLKENVQKGTAFLKANALKKGVHTTASGLQYQVIKEGIGANRPSPTTNNVVEVNYTGTLLDGTKFDSSFDRGEPVRFPVDGVIKGWTEGLQLMKEGDTYKFFIPQNLAYGEQQTGAGIGPGSTLIFEVELLKVLPKEASNDESGDESSDDDTSGDM